MKKIVFKIDPKGRTEIATSGFSGEECKRASAPFERALGGGRVSEKLTDEFYAATNRETEELRQS